MQEEDYPEYQSLQQQLEIAEEAQNAAEQSGDSQAAATLQDIIDDLRRRQAEIEEDGVVAAIKDGASGTVWGPLVVSALALFEGFRGRRKTKREMAAESRRPSRAKADVEALREKIAILEGQVAQVQTPVYIQPQQGVYTYPNGPTPGDTWISNNPPPQ